LGDFNFPLGLFSILAGDLNNPLGDINPLLLLVGDFMTLFVADFSYDFENIFGNLD